MSRARPLAVIREAECIGCTKCIQACPVDAILGSHRLMHTVIADECIGCELCLAPCPVDCIDLVAAPPSTIEAEEEKSLRAKLRVKARKERLKESLPNQPLEEIAILDPQAYIAAALNRKKSS